MLSPLHSASARTGAGFTLRRTLLAALAAALIGQVLPAQALEVTPAPLDLHAIIIQPAQPAPAITRQDPTQPVSALLLAHHEGTLGTTQLLTTGITGGSTGTGSLWANMLIPMAFSRDAELQKIGRKMHRMNSFVLGTVAATSGLGLAQSIDGLVKLQEDPHPLDPPVMGLIGSSISVVSVGTEIVLGHHYGKQLKVRQDKVIDAVLDTLDALKDKGPTPEVKSSLTTLVGDEAAQEFLQLWGAVHK